MLFRSLGVSLLFVFGLSSFAQPADLGDWLIYFGNKKINSRWNCIMRYSIEIIMPLVTWNNCYYVPE